MSQTLPMEQFLCYLDASYIQHHKQSKETFEKWGKLLSQKTFLTGARLRFYEKKVIFISAECELFVAQDSMNFSTLSEEFQKQIKESNSRWGILFDRDTPHDLIFFQEGHKKSDIIILKNVSLNPKFE